MLENKIKGYQMQENIRKCLKMQENVRKMLETEGKWNENVSKLTNVQSENVW